MSRATLLDNRAHAVDAGVAALPFLWTQRQDIGPSARFGHALAYDASRSRTLLVGGDAAGTLLRDTWLWDGEAWTQVEDIGPSGRAGHAIAYDSGRQRVVLFGGRGPAALSDTWEWDGEAWTQLEDTGPSPRFGHALAHDSGRDRVVLFGGWDTTLSPFDDTWEWNGDEWTQVADTGPSPRAGHAMCFEAGAGRTVLCGGSDESDTWSWNGTAWTEVNDVGPAPCRGAGLVSTGQSCFLFGGIDETANPDALYRLTWELSGTDWTERQDIGPAARHGHAMAYDSARGRVVLFGGADVSSATLTSADLFADTWEMPAAAETPGPEPDGSATLVSFTIVPDVVTDSDIFTITVGLDEPTPAPVVVDLFIDGSGVGGMGIGAGTSSADTSLTANDIGLASGTYLWGATLGAVSLTATLEVQ